MIITISGPPGSGKTSVAKIIAKDISADLVSAGSIFRKMAKEMEIDILQLNKIAEKDFSIDSKLDNEILNQILEARKSMKNIIVESHIAGWLFKEYSDLSFYLNAPLRERARRISIRDKTTYEEALLEIMRREYSHYTRFMLYYGIDITDISLFDLSLNTSKLSPQEIANLLEQVISLSFKTV
ncbi:(d)CMP kinase [Sulfuracidifex metallicus]|uniref:Cytidylate kinase n=1 Tax=Sulfuracidifex metallicus DSM 6482 = JCM 9184 TaxID=523847 RepID=A0A6A9QRV3_SULME|nr:AAA family ATPase [Sulfuracidifex metallicus]MCY0860392.1 AAA family ATPase [Sulfolobaceae archaeon]MUN28533.1 AAA family ATPase [Sulfuracidifex metallicus DSM 6482 = JCM 9184]WOE50929.1 AAA family ATPase [Sulfuracidifex metallicus DSM 6482 = JCM 9184]